MVDFQALFEKEQTQPIRYKDKQLYWADKFPLEGSNVLIIGIESTKSKYKQGVSVDITGYCQSNGVLYKKNGRIDLSIWEDAQKQQVELVISTKKDFVWIQNIWEFIDYTGKKIVSSGVNGAAMIVEEIPNGRRYRCNDGEPDDDFDDIIFTVTRKSKG